MNKMKLLFLDIDGVLNNHTYNEIAKSNTLDKKYVENLNKIIHETDCHIVLSSAWRYMILHNEITMEGFEYLLRTHGVTSKVKVFSITCADEVVPLRHEQIQHFLYLFDNVKFAILDDLDMSIEFPHNFVLVNDGLTEEQANKVIKILNEI